MESSSDSLRKRVEAILDIALTTVSSLAESFASETSAPSSEEFQSKLSLVGKDADNTMQPEAPGLVKDRDDEVQIFTNLPGAERLSKIAIFRYQRTKAKLTRSKLLPQTKNKLSAMAVQKVKTKRGARNLTLRLKTPQTSIISQVPSKLTGKAYMFGFIFHL